MKHEVRVGSSRIPKQLSINSVAIGATADKKRSERIASCTKVWSVVSVDMVCQPLAGSTCGETSPLDSILR